MCLRIGRVLKISTVLSVRKAGCFGFIAYLEKHLPRLKVLCRSIPTSSPLQKPLLVYTQEKKKAPFYLSTQQWPPPHPPL